MQLLHYSPPSKWASSLTGGESTWTFALQREPGRQVHEGWAMSRMVTIATSAPGGQRESSCKTTTGCLQEPLRQKMAYAHNPTRRNPTITVQEPVNAPWVAWEKSPKTVLNVSLNLTGSKWARVAIGSDDPFENWMGAAGTTVAYVRRRPHYGCACQSFVHHLTLCYMIKERAICFVQAPGLLGRVGNAPSQQTC